MLGKKEERAFELATQTRYGLSVIIERLNDSLDSGKLVAPRFADFLLLFEGYCCYVEVKSTAKVVTKWSTSGLREGQWRGIRRAKRLGMDYWVVLCTAGVWYKFKVEDGQKTVLLTEPWELGTFL